MMDILIIKMSALGDVIQALPVIRALKQGFPGARIDWLVEDGAAPIVRSHPGVDRVVVWRRGAWREAWRSPASWPEAAVEIRRTAAELLQRRYDLALDLQGLLKSGIWMGLSRARRKVGYHNAREGSHIFLTERIQNGDPDLHAVERYLLLVEQIGGGRQTPEFGLSPSQEGIERLQEVLSKGGWEAGTPYAVLVPGARWKTKQWEAASFSQTAERIVRGLGLQVAVSGGPQDRPLGEMIIKGMRSPALNLAGSTDISALTALMAGASVVISTDSGPMHLAAAVGTPVVALFGPTAPWRTGPYGKGHKVLRAAVSCSPCFLRKCRTRRCMRQIGPEQVLDAVKDLLGDRAEAVTGPSRGRDRGEAGVGLALPLVPGSA